MKVTSLGPNLPRPLCDTGETHVHAAGCADIKRRYPAIAVKQSCTIDVDSIAEIVEFEYPSSDFCYDPDDPDEYDGYRNAIHVFPCVTLPETEEQA